MEKTRAYAKISQPTANTLCLGDPSAFKVGILSALGGIPRWEARYFAICLTLTPNIAIIPEFYTIFVADIQARLGRKSNIQNMAKYFY